MIPPQEVDVSNQQTSVIPPRMRQPLTPLLPHTATVEVAKRVKNQTPLPGRAAPRTIWRLETARRPSASQQCHHFLRVFPALSWVDRAPPDAVSRIVRQQARRANQPAAEKVSGIARRWTPAPDDSCLPTTARGAEIAPPLSPRSAGPTDRPTRADRKASPNPRGWDGGRY